MKVYFHRLLSVAMALLLLASTTSWKVDKHYCMGHLVDLAFFTDAKGCGMDEMAVEGSVMTCCDSETVIIDAQDDLSFSLEENDLASPVFLVAFLHSYKVVFQVLEKRLVPHEVYPPPLLVKDIQLLDQVFLI